MSKPANRNTWPPKHGVRCTDCAAILTHPDTAREVFEDMIEREGELPIPLMTYVCLACAAKRDAA